MFNQKLNQQTGLISRALITTLPFFQKLRQWKVEGLITSLILKLISFYQKRISPYKGFRCAHRVLHQGTSCSGFFAINLKQVGISDAIPLQAERFRQCKQAYNILKHRRIRQTFYPSLTQAIERPGRYRKHRRNHQTCDGTYCDVISGTGCDTFLCDCDLSDIECDGIDISGCDIPCDIDFCDCG